MRFDFWAESGKLKGVS